MQLSRPRHRKSVWRRWVDAWVAFFTIGSFIWFAFKPLPELLRRLSGMLSSPWSDISYAVVMLLFFCGLLPIGISLILEEFYPLMLENLWGRPERTGTTVDDDKDVA